MWSASGRVQRSTTCSASLWGLAFSSIQTLSSLNPIESMTSVSPSHRPISSPKNDGSGSSECLQLGVDRDQTEIAVPVQEHDLVRALQNFERQAAGVVPRDAADDAEALGIDGRGQVVLERRLAGRRQRQLPPGRSLPMLPTGLVSRRPLPVATEIGLAAGRARRGPSSDLKSATDELRCPPLPDTERHEQRATTAGAAARSTGCDSLRASVSGRGAGDDAAVGQRHAARIDRGWRRSSPGSRPPRSCRRA